MLLTLSIGVGWAATVWSENWDGASTDNLPTAPTNNNYTNALYSYTNGNGETKIFNEKLAGGENAPELLVGKSGGSFKVTITLNGVSGGLTLKYYCNKNIGVSGTTDDTTDERVSDPTNSGNCYTRTITVPSGAQTLVLTFKTTNSQNARLDDITLSSSTDEPDPTAPSGTITFTPATGEVTSGTPITMLFSGECSGIKYTTDGTTTPDEDNGYVYDASNPPVITAATTIKAAAYNYSNNQYAFGEVATATYTVVIPTVDYDGSVTFVATKDKPSSDNPKSITKTPVTFTCTSGTLDNGSEYRLFKDSETTFSVPNDYKIVKIEFTGDSRNPVNGFGTTQGLTFSGNDGVWIGEAQSVSFTASNNQVRCTQIIVYYTEPETTGPKYYLVGDFNGWANAITSTSPSYKFHENNGTYTLTVQDLPACEFKIIRSDNGTSAAEWYGVINGQEANIHHNHHTGIGVTHDNGGNFRLQSAGTTSFSFEVNGGDPFNLTVTRDASLSIMGTFNSWTEEPMTFNTTDEKWTTSRTIYENQEFRFVDEFGQWQGGTYWIKEEHFGDNIPIVTGDNVFKMTVSGDYTLNVNKGLETLVVTKNEGGSSEMYAPTTNLVAGDEYLVVGKSTDGHTFVMSNNLDNNSHATGIVVTPDGEGRIAATDGMAIITLGGNENDVWTLYVEDKGYVAPKGKNNIQFSETSAAASISFVDGTAVVNFGGDYPFLKFNPQYEWFACYGSNSTGTYNVYLYKKLSASNRSAAPTIAPGGGNVVGLSQLVEITQANGGEIYYTVANVTQGQTPTTPNADSEQYDENNPLTIRATQLGDEITVTAIAIETVDEVAKAPSYPVSATFKFIAPDRPVFSFDETTHQVSFGTPELTGTKIYYTTKSGLKNNEIVEQGAEYTGPFTVSGTVTYYAVSVYNEGISSIVSATYSGPVLTAKLKEIETNGILGEYTIENDLQVVAVNGDKRLAWARDLESTAVSSPSESATGGETDPIDFMRYVVHNDPDHQSGPWQQNNWVMLRFPATIATNTWGQIQPNCVIKGGTLKGIYSDNINYTIEVSNDFTFDAEYNNNSTVKEYTPNVYSPANFHSSNIQTANVTIDGETVTKYYWFMTPKPMEVCKFTWALYYDGEYNGVNYDEGFYMQQEGDTHLKGGVGVDLSYNTEQPTLVNGESYRFTGVIMKTGKKSGAKAEPNPNDYHPQEGSERNEEFKVAATDLTKADGQVITAVSDVKSGSDVVSVTYCDLAGRMSQKPFAGVNIIVTRYSDGTVKTTKAIK